MGEKDSTIQSWQRLIEVAESNRRCLLADLAAQPAGLEWCRRYTAIADRVLRAIYRRVHRSGDHPFAVVAVGGYGRRELAPFSDLDLTFIPLGELRPEMEAEVRRMFHAIIEVFGQLRWEIGYALRLPSDCPALDPTTRTSLLDARLVAGSKEAFRVFQSAFWESFPVAEFLISKTEERRLRKARTHDTPRVVEFHLRDGAGGLRDVQTARWIARSLRRKLPSEPFEEYDTILAVRNVLHHVTERKEDTLLRTRFETVADHFGLTPEALAERVIRAGERCQATYEDALRLIRTSRFVLSRGGVFAERNVCMISKAADVGSAVAGVCRAARLSIEIRPAPKGLRMGDLARTNEYLTSGETALRALDAAGLLDEVLPEFAACRYLLSRDSAHRYSVGEHTLRAIAYLDASRAAPEFAEAWADVPNHRPLYLAMLLHDLGKIVPKRKHAVVGAEIAKRVCDRLHITGDEKKTTVWLVRDHLLMAEVARTHDLSDPRTLQFVAKRAGRADRLAMLFLLTYADTSAVNEGIWSGPLAASAFELYERARQLIGVETVALDPALYRRQALRRLGAEEAEGAAVAEFLEKMPMHYLLGTDRAQFALHADYVRRAREGEITVAFHHDRESGTTDVTVCLRDLPKPGLLSRLLGIFYAHDVTVHGVRAASTEEEHPVALDVLNVSFRGGPLPAGLCSVLARDIRERVRNRREVDALLRQRGKDPDRRQELYRYRFYPGTPSVLEIEAVLGRGMPYRVSRLLAELQWNILVARIGQSAGRAVARFTVQRPDGKPLTKADVQKALRRSLRKV
jgi:[protein-PII] uridylyltransferase